MSSLEKIHIIDLINHMCEQHTNMKALIFKDRFLTYEEVNELSNKIANYLINDGVLKGTNIIVSIDISEMLVVTILGILKAGCVYVPLDKTLPQKRKEYIIKNINSKIVIDDLWIKKFIETKGNHSEDRPGVIINQSDTAYIIHTSGSTGAPKGVKVSHRNLYSLMTQGCENFMFKRDDVWIMNHNYSFDFSIWEMFTPLVFGSSLVLFEREMLFDFDFFYGLIKKHRVTILNFTPRVFYEIEKLRKQKNIEFNNIRYLIFGGDKLIPKKMSSWIDAHPKTKIINMYGITEVTVHASFKELTPEDLYKNISNIGKPLKGMEFYLLDENLLPVSDGEIGEIYIQGNQVTQGYYNEEEKTIERYIVKEKYGKLYKSGDLARCINGSEFEYIGRCDSQVKVNGHRIELNEIASVINDIEGIDNVLIKTEERNDYTFIVAYYQSDIRKDDKYIIEQLKETLPDYMIPKFYIHTHKFELDSNGKIERKLLPSFEVSKEESFVENDFQSQDDSIMKELYNIFYDVLNTGDLDVKEPFFNLGASSLQIILVFNKIKEKWPNTITITDFFEYKSIYELSVYLSSCIKKKENNDLTFIDL